MDQEGTTNYQQVIRRRMASDTTALFTQSVRSHDSTAVQTTADDFDETLSSVMTPPAVGVSLPIDGVSLPAAITTDPSPQQIQEARTGVTPVGLGVAEYGTIAIQSRATGDEPISLYPERHVAVLRESDIVPGMSEALEWLEREIETGCNSNVFATGPSATGDMGKLVQGVHGPKEVYVIVVTDR